MLVNDEKELGKALKDGENTIEIEVGPLGGKVLKIKTTGPVAFGL
jgi:hypothetical protein